MLLDQLDENTFEQAPSILRNALFITVTGERETSRNTVFPEFRWIQGSEDPVLRRDRRTTVRDGRMLESLGQVAQLSRGNPRRQTRNGRRNGSESIRRLTDQRVRGYGDLLFVSVE